MPREQYTMTQLMDELKLSRQAIYNKMDAKVFKGEKLRGRWYFKEADNRAAFTYHRRATAARAATEGRK